MRPVVPASRGGLHAVILADRRQPGLKPILNRSCPALLPVGGKKVIELILEELRSVGVKKAHLVVSEGAAELKTLVGEGIRFGIAVEHLLTRGDRPLSQILLHLDPLISGKDLLVVSADRLRQSALEDFLQKVEAEHMTAAEAYGRKDEQLGLRYLTADSNGKHNLPIRFTPVRLDGARGCVLDSLKTYMTVNFEIAAGWWTDLNIPARQEAKGVRIGRLTRFDCRSIQLGPVLIGAHSFVHSRSSLGPNVVAGDHCYIDRGAKLSEVLIMPGTYVGESVRINRMIIDGNRLIDPLTSEVTHVDSSQVVSRLASEGPWTALTVGIGRLMAVLVSLLALPLFPLVLVACLLENWRAPFRFTVRDASAKTGGSFRTIEGATSIPLLCHLTWLLAVAAGHLRWVGVRPLRARKIGDFERSWEKVRQDAPNGLVGPAQWAFLGGADETECRLADSLFAVQKGALSNPEWLVIFVVSLFSSRFWLPRGEVYLERRRPSRLSRQLSSLSSGIGR